MNWVRAICGLLVIWAWATSASRAGNLLVNGSFELGPDPGSYLPIGDGSTDLVGWLVRGLRPGAGIDYKGTYWQQVDGERSIDLNGTPGPGRIEQAFGTIPTRPYRVRFLYAANPTGFAEPMIMESSVGIASAQFEANGVGHTRSDVGWKVGSWEFIAVSRETTLSFWMIYPEAGSEGMGLDAVSVEPAFLYGDADGDCEVGSVDYAIWAAKFGQSGVGLSADFDGDESVGAGDYALWAANFGNTCPPDAAAVPEASTFSLALVSLGLALIWRAARVVPNLGHLGLFVDR